MIACALRSSQRLRRLIAVGFRAWVTRSAQDVSKDSTKCVSMVSDWSCYLLESTVCPATGRLYIEEPVPIIERVGTKIEFTPTEDYDGDCLDGGFWRRWNLCLWRRSAAGTCVWHPGELSLLARGSGLVTRRQHLPTQC